MHHPRRPLAPPLLELKEHRAHTKSGACWCLKCKKWNLGPLLRVALSETSHWLLIAPNSDVAVPYALPLGNSPLQFEIGRQVEVLQRCTGQRGYVVARVQPGTYG